ncbi:MAG: transglycosylase domain-containing protein [Bacteroidia bacterium]|nr:transglycosylase domain-containing protein [Bacteroidia bacterium]
MLKELKKTISDQSNYNRISKKLWIYFFFGILLFIAFILLVKTGLLGKMPDIDELENPKSNLASEVYSSDKVLLGKYYYENRANCDFKDLPSNLVNALIATEDVRFYKHSGIDIKALSRAVIFLGKDGGASTITQQLAKNLFHNRSSFILTRILQKVKEMIIAIELERQYTKEEIISLYFNTVPFGGNSYGIKTASKTFFNKKPIDLTAEEAALLVGMLKGSTLYNPVRNPEKSVKRRNVVLNQMYKYNFISSEEYEKYSNIPLKLNISVQNHNEGIAPYFRDFLREFLSEWCKSRNLNIYRDGLKIYTTINSKMQLYAERAVNKHISQLQKEFFNEWKGQNPWRLEKESWKEDPDYLWKNLKKTGKFNYLNKKYDGNRDSIMYWLRKKENKNIFTWRGELDTMMSTIDSLKYYKSLLHTGMMSMDPNTGEIKAWVGGINFKNFQYDHVNTSANRQVGSTFKPFVYALAVDNDLSPCFVAPTAPVTFKLPEGGYWTPKNSIKLKSTHVNLYQGLKLSINTVTAFLMKKLGEKSPYSVRTFVGKMGVDSSKIKPYPSICLGSMDLSVYEMVGAYSSFANEGEWIEPIFITRIEDKYGNVIEEFAPRRNEVMRKQTAYAMCKMMELTTLPGGTASRMRSTYGIPYEIPIAGKTGTTQNNSDGWFIGVTPDLVTGVWVGCEDRQVHFRSTALGQGGHMAMPVFAYYMKDIYNDRSLPVSKSAFKKPNIEFTIELDCENYEGNDFDVNATNEEPDPIEGVDF